MNFHFIPGQDNNATILKKKNENNKTKLTNKKPLTNQTALQGLQGPFLEGKAGTKQTHIRDSGLLITIR